MSFSANEITAAVSEYFRSEHWSQFLNELKRGEEVRHAHIYLDSVLDPYDIANILTAYFEEIGYPIERKTKILPLKPELVNVYNVKPKGMAHFEFFLTYKPGVILQPSSKDMEFWDDKFMEEYYKQYNFREVREHEINEIEAYFRSTEWKEHFYTMMDIYAGVIHSHGLIETSVHPDVLMPYAIKSLEEMGLQIGRAVSLVWNANGKWVGKLTLLLSCPEIVLELEWYYNPHVVIRPMKPTVYQFATQSMLSEYLSKYDRIKIPAESQTNIINDFLINV